MAKIINLSAVRKAKAKLDALKTADANAAKFGRTRAEKTAEKARADKARRDLDGHERE